MSGTPQDDRHPSTDDPSRSLSFGAIVANAGASAECGACEALATSPAGAARKEASEIEPVACAIERLQELNGALAREVARRTQERDRLWANRTTLLAVTASDLTILEVNPAWSAILGWTDAQLIGRRHTEFVHSDDRSHALSWAARLTRGEGVEELESRFLCNSGGPRTIAWSVDYGDGVVYLLGRDLTCEREQAAMLCEVEEALRQARKMEAVGQLTSGFAHDFNNLLAVIVGSLDRLSERIGPDDARTRRYVDAANDGARRAAGLVQRLLAFSLRRPLQPKPVDANGLVSAMSDLLDHALGAAVEVEVVLAAGLWRTLVDPCQLENALLNLAINARDAMNGDGRLTIRTRNAVVPQRYVSAPADVPAGRYVLISVSDTGSGMSADVLAKAFDPFFTTKAVGTGTGLGLSQVRDFAATYLGHVAVRSQVGVGTMIEIYLPSIS